MALISRAIPQVNVFFLGLPLKILVGIASSPSRCRACSTGSAACSPP
ncbi:MAG: flagellar biosynthetic protein FliR [Chloroflexota bacterium]